MDPVWIGYWHALQANTPADAVFTCQSLSIGFAQLTYLMKSHIGEMWR